MGTARVQRTAATALLGNGPRTVTTHWGGRAECILSFSKRYGKGTTDTVDWSWA
jgi:hypothetical protein